MREKEKREEFFFSSVHRTNHEPLPLHPSLNQNRSTPRPRRRVTARRCSLPGRLARARAQRFVAESLFSRFDFLFCCFLRPTPPSLARSLFLFLRPLSSTHSIAGPRQEGQVRRGRQRGRQGQEGSSRCFLLKEKRKEEETMFFVVVFSPFNSPLNSSLFLPLSNYQLPLYRSRSPRRCSSRSLTRPENVSCCSDSSAVFCFFSVVVVVREATVFLLLSFSARFACSLSSRLSELACAVARGRGGSAARRGGPRAALSKNSPTLFFCSPLLPSPFCFKNHHPAAKAKPAHKVKGAKGGEAALAGGEAGKGPKVRLRCC